MEKNDSILEKLNTYSEAYSVMAPLILHTQLLGLLQGAYATGVLKAALNPSTVEAIAAETEMSMDRTQDICRALDAFGIFVKADNCYSLTEQWALLVTSDLIRTFQVSVSDAFAKAQMFSQPGASYWQLSSEERLALAKGVTFNPSSSNTTDFYEFLFRDMLPEVVDRLTQREIRYLELGCGVGGGLNGLLRTYPRVTAVAVDLAKDVLAEAQATAEALGHSERVTFIHDDARNFDARNAFDLVYWSQFFFPRVGRPEVLQVAYAALKPLGYLFAPLLLDPISEENIHSAEGRQYAMSQLMYGGWDIPRLSAAEVKAEIEAAGFINVEVRTKPFLRLILAQRSDIA
ncbi:MAG: class I SAM-dependent methyltransferase [Anaerolineae bacterium]